MIPATLNSVRWDEINQIKYRFQALQFSSDGRFYNSSCCDVIYGSSNKFEKSQCVKSIRTQSYSGPHFPAFGRNTESRDIEYLRIHSECGKMRTRITPNTNTFYAVLAATEKYHLFKVNSRSTGNTGIILMSLLLTLSIYNTFFFCSVTIIGLEQTNVFPAMKMNGTLSLLIWLVHFLFIVFTSFTKQLFFYKQLVLNFKTFYAQYKMLLRILQFLSNESCLLYA